MTIAPRIIAVVVLSVASAFAVPHFTRRISKDGKQAPIHRKRVEDDQNARSMGFGSAAKSTAFEDRGLDGPPPDPRWETHVRMLKEWSLFVAYMDRFGNPEALNGWDMPWRHGGMWYALRDFQRIQNGAGR